MRIKKIVFVEPKSTHLHVYSKVTIPRLGSVLLGTILRDLGYEVKVYIEDIAPVDMAEVLSADLVGISTITSTAPPSYRLADTVRAAGIPVVLGGTHVTFISDEGLEHGDYLVRGEGEQAIVELVEALEGKRDVRTIPGLSYWRDGEKVHNPDRPLEQDLEANPIPDFALVQGFKRGGIISVDTSRGCPYPCTFCSVPAMYGSGYRYKSTDRVLREMTFQGAPHDTSYVFFADDIFAVNRKRTKELLGRMIAEGITPQWGAQVRTETVDDDEMLTLFQRSNCFNVYVGFESINPRTLELFKKKQDLAKIERSIAKFHDKGIRIHGMFVVGSDEDDVETIEATGQFARDRGIESVQFMILTPIPGSPDYRNLFATGKKEIISRDWSCYDGHHVVHVPQRMTPYELQIATMKAMRKFYSWGSIIEGLVKKRDVFTAAIRFYGRRLISEWEKQNGDYVRWLRDELYGEAAKKPVPGRRVAVPEALLAHETGRLLREFLGRLGLQVITLAEEELQRLHALAQEGLEKLQERADCYVAPLLAKARQGEEELQARIRGWREVIEANLDRLPRVVDFPIDLSAESPIFTPFARIGLLFTRDLNRVRTAYRQAVAALGEAAATTAPGGPVSLPVVSG